MKKYTIALVIIALVAATAYALGAFDTTPRSASGITLSDPDGRLTQTAEGTQLVFSNDFYRAKTGKIGTTTLNLIVSEGVASNRPASGIDHCSIVSSTATAKATSTESYAIDGETFIHAKVTEAGTSQTFYVDRYVQQITDSTCRFIELMIHFSNPGAFASAASQIAEIQANNAELGTLIDQKSEQVFNSIKVSKKN